MTELKLLGFEDAEDYAAATARLKDTYKGSGLTLYEKESPMLAEHRDRISDHLDHANVIFAGVNGRYLHVVALLKPYEKITKMPHLDALQYTLQNLEKGGKSVNRLEIYQLRKTGASWPVWARIGTVAAGVVTAAGTIYTLYSGILKKDAVPAVKPIVVASAPQNVPLPPVTVPNRTLAPPPITTLAPPPQQAPLATPVTPPFNWQGRWQIGRVGNCQSRYYLWSMQDGNFRFIDQTGNVDVEQVLQTSANGGTYLTKTMRSDHIAGASAAIGARWRYELQPQGQVLVHNLNDNRSFSLYRCP